MAASNPLYQAENLGIFVANFSLSVTEMAALDSATQPAGCPFWPGSACFTASKGPGCGGGGGGGAELPAR